MLAFLLILLPLLVLAWQAWQSLNALSDQAALVNRTTLIDARRSEAMTNAALEMERSYRQYCVLDDPTLAKVYQSQRKRYSEMLDAHAGELPDDKLYRALRQDLNNLAQLQCNNSGPDAAAAARLEAFASANTKWCRPRAQWCSLVGSNFSVKSPNVGNILVGNRWCYFW